MSDYINIYKCLGNIRLMLSKKFILDKVEVNRRTLMFDSPKDSGRKIVIWIRDGLITDLWFDGGSDKVCRFDGHVLDKAVLDEIICIEATCRRLGRFICTECHREYDIEHLGGTHLAGRYCGLCWKKHEG